MHLAKALQGVLSEVYKALPLRLKLGGTVHLAMQGRISPFANFEQLEGEADLVSWRVEHLRKAVNQKQPRIFKGFELIN